MEFKPLIPDQGGWMNSKTGFSGGRNIAIKVPPPHYETTVEFYRDVVGLQPVEKHAPSVVFAFGTNQLWIDRVPGLSQAEVWLELITDDISVAAEHLAACNVARRDDIEPLPDGFQGFWIANPASIIHLVCKDDEMM
jgi:catechol 2,3-dioxygenase-like lactoylglutathione lyase family enzyme